MRNSARRLWQYSSRTRLTLRRGAIERPTRFSPSSRPKIQIELRENPCRVQFYLHALSARTICSILSGPLSRYEELGSQVPQNGTGSRKRRSGAPLLGRGSSPCNRSSPGNAGIPVRPHRASCVMCRIGYIIGTSTDNVQCMAL